MADTSKDKTEPEFQPASLAEVMERGVGTREGNEVPETPPAREERKPGADAKSGDRDAAGKFKAKDDKPAARTEERKPPATVREPDTGEDETDEFEDDGAGDRDDGDRKVPLSALRKERSSRQQVEARFEALSLQTEALLGTVERIMARQAQPPAKEKVKLDFYDDPTAFIQNAINEAMGGVREIVEPLRSGTASTAENMARMVAEGKHGAEVVDAAYAALETMAKNPRTRAMAQAEHARIMGARNPFDALVNWHKDNTARTKYGGGDVETIVNAAIAKFAKKYGIELPEGDDDDAEAAGAAHREQPARIPRNGQRLPSNFAQGSRSAGGRDTAVFGGVKTLGEIMQR